MRTKTADNKYTQRHDDDAIWNVEIVNAPHNVRLVAWARVRDSG